MNLKDETVRQESGFTLIEVLVSTIIVSVVMVTAVSVYLVAYRGYDRSAVINLIQSEGNRMMNVFTRTVHASAKAEVIDDTLVLEINADTLEYSENGQCKKVAFIHQAPTETENGSLIQEFRECLNAEITGGTYTNVINDQGDATAVNVLSFVPSVTSDIAQKTYLVGVEFTLGRGVGRSDRSNYNVEVPFNTKISTRGYVN